VVTLISHQYIHAMPQLDQDIIDEMEDEFVGLRKFSAIGRFINVTVTTSHSLSTLNKMIQNYGCHCFPQFSRTVGGRGEPVDDKDALCRKLARCHSCVEMDHNNACDADDDGYKYDIDINAGTISCAANTDSCKMDSCLCDKAYAEELGGIWDDNTFNLAHWLSKHNPAATLDYDADCTKTLGSANDQCCGDNPERRPYSSLVSECCADKSIQASGTC